MTKWLVKVRRYTQTNGVYHESVVDSAPFKSHAQAIADGYNEAYQSDNYFVEEYDERVALASYEQVRLITDRMSAAARKLTETRFIDD